MLYFASFCSGLVVGIILTFWALTHEWGVSPKEGE